MPLFRLLHNVSFLAREVFFELFVHQGLSFRFSFELLYLVHHILLLLVENALLRVLLGQGLLLILLLLQIGAVGLVEQLFLQRLDGLLLLVDFVLVVLVLLVLFGLQPLDVGIKFLFALGKLAQLVLFFELHRYPGLEFGQRTRLHVADQFLEFVDQKHAFVAHLSGVALQVGVFFEEAHELFGAFFEEFGYVLDVALDLREALFVDDAGEEGALGDQIRVVVFELHLLFEQLADFVARQLAAHVVLGVDAPQEAQVLQGVLQDDAQLERVDLVHPQLPLFIWRIECCGGVGEKLGVEELNNTLYKFNKI